MNYSQHYSTKRTPQSEPIPGSGQVPNNAGGYAWRIDKWQQLERFLILGSEGGTYYVGERKLTVDNANAVLACINEDGVRVVKTIHEISSSNRAPKVDPSLFALAMATHFGDELTRRNAFSILSSVARTATQLFAFCEYRQAFGGWGRGMRNAVGKWYNDKYADRLAYQLVKYRQRNGWTHRDALRLAHPVPTDSAHDWLFRYATKDKLPQDAPGDYAKVIMGYELAKLTSEVKTWIRLINEYKLTWEMLPTEALRHADVWKALLPHMPAMALVRNLGRMTANGTLVPLSDEVSLVHDRIHELDGDRVHPWAILNALTTYAEGKSLRGDATWTPITSILDALDFAFYSAFGNVTPTGKRIALCVDVSGSMSSNTITSGFDGRNPIRGMAAAKAAAAMALVTANSEKNHITLAFNNDVSPVSMSPSERLDDVTGKIERMIGGGTNCAAPMQYCAAHKIHVDAFIILTDSETWQGNVHPAQAIQSYRRVTGINAKMVVVAMCANTCSIADPQDAGHINVVGFDTETPSLISDFIRG